MKERTFGDLKRRCSRDMVEASGRDAVSHGWSERERVSDDCNWTNGVRRWVRGTGTRGEREEYRL